MTIGDENARWEQICTTDFALTHRVLTAIDLESLEPAVGHEVDGIIGSRLFDDFVVEVDYEHHQLSIYASDQFRPKQETPLPIRVDQHGFHFVDATVVLPGLAPITGNFLIDSGAISTTALNEERAVSRSTDEPVRDD